MSTRRARRALVVGAGPAGLATAVLLRRAGFEVRVLEGRGDTAAGGSALTLWPNALAALERIGAAAPVLARSAPSAGLAMRTARGATLQYVAPEVMEGRCGGTGRALLRADLMDALYGLHPPGAVEFGARCVAVREERGTVVARCDDGREAEGDVLIGADGIRSRVRAALFGGGDLRFAGYAVARGVAGFADPGHPALLSLGAGRQFGLFPLPGGRMYWFAAFAAREGEAARDSGGPLLPLLQERFARWHGPVPEVLKATDPADVTVTDIHDRRPLRHWGRGSVALVGDAAHPSAPAMGQGTCQAFEDAVVLAGRLAGADDIPAALRAYAAERRRRAHSVTVQSHWMGRLGQWRHPLLCGLRDGMIRATPRRAQLRSLRTMFTFEPAG
ncbi:FAD-dependent monooxygenase [Streptomyces sp. TRM64462]|uniref:FAD-dependent monooxygenase n=1 Tax=Streptomyces sp. TRM64462 TaxID=2741726 RepID=UPI001586D858|nr:FAD-dependent monooxygenase [Streptomyces sp. TRM64462]